MWTEIEKTTWSDLTGLSSQKRHAGPPSTHKYGSELLHTFHVFAFASSGTVYAY